MIDLILIIVLIISSATTIYLFNLVFPIQEFISRILSPRNILIFLFVLGLSAIALYLSSLLPKEAPSAVLAGGGIYGLYEFLKWLTSSKSEEPQSQKSTDEVSSANQLLLEGSWTKETLQQMLSPVYPYPSAKIPIYIEGSLRAKFRKVLHKDESTKLEIVFVKKSKSESEGIHICDLQMPLPGTLILLLQAAAFDIGGGRDLISESITPRSLIEGDSEILAQFSWNLHPKTSGKHEINLVVKTKEEPLQRQQEILDRYDPAQMFQERKAIRVEKEKMIGIFPLRIRVTSFDGFTSKQVQIFAIGFSILTGLLSIATSIRGLGLW